MLTNFIKEIKNYLLKCYKKYKKRFIQNQNIFGVLMEASKVCSLGEITNALFEVGGQYRRNM